MIDDLKIQGDNGITKVFLLQNSLPLDTYLKS
jgi:hypothetical protein